jgi:hypothetical protein
VVVNGIELQHVRLLANGSLEYDGQYLEEVMLDSLGYTSALFKSAED